MSQPRAPRAFLTAEWRYLAMLNYSVAPETLLPYVPAGTELDTWNGQAFLSVVGFLFRDTRLLGVPVPWHREFEEINLRFYVRRETAGETRRAVTFIREMVPRRAIARVARWAYNEPYRAVPMRHRFGATHHGPGANAAAESARAPETVEYEWRAGPTWSRIAVVPTGESQPAFAGSEEEFITEHYWGYTRQRDGGTIEYRVTHPTWRVWQTRDARAEGDMVSTYGPALARVLSGAPSSAFLADGSAVTVFAPRRLPIANARLVQSVEAVHIPEGS